MLVLWNKVVWKDLFVARNLSPWKLSYTCCFAAFSSVSKYSSEMFFLLSWVLVLPNICIRNIGKNYRYVCLFSGFQSSQIYVSDISKYLSDMFFLFLGFSLQIAKYFFQTFHIIFPICFIFFLWGIGWQIYDHSTAKHFQPIF